MTNSSDDIDAKIGDNNKNVIVGKNITQNIYQNAAPQPVDQPTLDAALTRLAQLPTDHVPDVAPLPAGSSIPFSPNSHFVGRQADLTELARALKGENPNAVAINQIAAATGMGGIGKTQLAVAFAHRYGSYFAGGVHWISFADAGAIEAEIANAMARAMPPGFGEQSLPEQVRQALALWQSPLPRLLIFDNCEDPNLLAAWRPPTGGARVLLTSRRDQWDASLNVQPLPLGTLPRPESISLLEKFVDPDPVLDQIAAELGDLPLALHLAGSFLHAYKFDVTPAAYLAQLQEPDLLAHRSLMQGELSPTGHDQHVARTFALSYEKLDPSNDGHSLALDLLHRAAHFAPSEPIARDLLRLTHQPLIDEPPLLTDAARQLTNLGLVTLDQQSGELLLHRLVINFVQQADAVRDADAQASVHAALRNQAIRLNKAGYPNPLLAWQPHLRHVIDAGRNRTETIRAELCNELGVHLRMMGDYEGARPYYEKALAIFVEVLGESHPDTAQSLNNLGVLLDVMGDYERARPYYERALAINEEALGESHPYTAQSLNNLGVLLEAIGDYEGAIQSIIRALAIRQQVLGESHPDTAQSLNNLGTLLDTLGDYEGARPYYEKALAIFEKVLGENHPDTAQILNNLGTVLDRLEEYEEARPYYERALAIRQEVLGETHPDTARSLNNLGILFYHEGDKPAATQYVAQALKIYKEMLRSDHPITIETEQTLSIILSELEQSSSQPSAGGT